MTITESKLLSSNELSFITNAVVNSFDFEYIRIHDDNLRESIIDKFIDLYYKVEIFAFFTPINIKYMYESLFEDENLRSFILNVAERTSLSISVSDVNVEYLYNTIADGVSRGKIIKTDNQYVMISNEVNSSMYVSKEVVLVTLRDNFWIVTLYLLLLNMYQTEAYKLNMKIINK